MANGNCAKCNQPLDGASRSYCKACGAAYAKARRDADPNAGEYQLAWQRANRDKVRKYKRRFTIKQYGLTELQLLDMRMAQGGPLCQPGL